MKRQKRKDQILKRKNFLPTFLVTILLWAILVTLIYFVDPGTFGAIFSFFILVFFTFLFTFSLIFADRRRGLVTSIALVFFLILSFLGIGNVLNFVLIVAIALTLELYFSWK